MSTTSEINAEEMVWAPRVNPWLIGIVVSLAVGRLLPDRQRIADVLLARFGQEGFAQFDFQGGPQFVEIGQCLGLALDRIENRVVQGFQLGKDLR